MRATMEEERAAAGMGSRFLASTQPPFSRRGGIWVRFGVPSVTPHAPALHALSPGGLVGGRGGIGGGGGGGGGVGGGEGGMGGDGAVRLTSRNDPCGTVR
jgi:hypothetical protein